MKKYLSAQLIIIGSFLILIFTFATCKYSTRDTAPIPAEIKTFRVNYLENKARYVNPQFTPQLRDKLQQKIIGQTRLRQTNSDDAHYDISGYLSDYSVSTAGVANQTSSADKLNVSFHLDFKNTITQKTTSFDITRNYPFDANRSLQDFESKALNDIIKDMSDDIFNKIFSNW